VETQNDSPGVGLLLTKPEIAELTGKKRCDAQILELQFMGIEHKQRADGSIVVLRAHLDRVLGGAVSKTEPVRKKKTPNWSALDAKKTKP
jgi:hypothetical protein